MKNKNDLFPDVLATFKSFIKNPVDNHKKVCTQTLFSFKKMQGAGFWKPYSFSFVHCPQSVISTSQTLPGGAGLL